MSNLPISSLNLIISLKKDFSCWTISQENENTTMGVKIFHKFSFESDAPLENSERVRAIKDNHMF
jgi:hypothetical protein